MSLPDYPLRFDPIFRSYLWGGRRLESLFGKCLPGDRPVAESWEVVDHGTDQSRVRAGPLRGKTLGELGRQFPQALMGTRSPANRFPLLFKLLDAERALSVQVHPNDRQAASLDPPDLGKTEAWVVLHAEPESSIYAGLLPGINRATLAHHVQQQTTEQCLHRFTPRVGDCVFIPAGTVHALGAGLVIAEIQQSSDTTFRLYDWNRVDADGHRRRLHIEQALEVIDYDRGPVAPQIPRPLPGTATVERLVACDQFTLDRHRMSGAGHFGGDGRCHLVVVTRGEVDCAGDPVGRPLRRGEVALLPAAAGRLAVSTAGPAEVLDIGPGPAPPACEAGELAPLP